MSKVVTVFGKKKCAKCETTKRKIDHLLAKRGLASEVAFRFHDLDTPEGLAEGAFFDVGKVPTTIVSVDGSDRRRWDGELPHSEDVLAALTGDGFGATPD
ncbi:MAG: hypothetical protein V2A58_12715 [Planctomycetota bacterium]